MKNIIEDVRVRKILDSRGNPTVEVDVVTWNGFGRATTPNAATHKSAHSVLNKDSKKITVKIEENHLNYLTNSDNDSCNILAHKSCREKCCTCGYRPNSLNPTKDQHEIGKYSQSPGCIPTSSNISQKILWITLFGICILGVLGWIALSREQTFIGMGVITGIGTILAKLLDKPQNLVDNDSKN